MKALVLYLCFSLTFVFANEISLEKSVFISEIAFDSNFESKYIMKSDLSKVYYINLKRKKKLDYICLYWGDDFLKSFLVKISSNGKNWMTVYNKQNGLNSRIDKIILKRNLSFQYICIEMTREFEVAELAEICFTGALEEVVIASTNSSQSSNNNEIKKPEQPKDQVFQDKDSSIRLKKLTVPIPI